MSLQITKEERENRELLLTIEVDQARVDKELRKVARKFASDYRIPGFRKGKAPYHVIAQKVGLPALYNEFVGQLGEEVYKDALEQEELEPYSRANLEDVSYDPLTYKLVMPMEPEIELGDYHSLRVEEPAVEVSEEDVEAQLEQFRSQHADWVEVERPSKYGDMLSIDIHSVIPPETEDDEPITVFNETEWDVTPDQEHPMEPPGLDEKLIGLSAGDEREFELSWPEDYQSVNAGKTAQINVKVNRVKSYESPPLTDELAQVAGPDFETVDDLTESVRTSLTEQATLQNQNEYFDAVLSKLLEQSTLNYPSVVVEDQLDSMLNNLQAQLRQMGLEDMDLYYRQTGQTEEEFRESLRDEAKNQAERNLILSEILRVENLEVSDEELQERMTLVAQSSDPASVQQLFAQLNSEGGRAILTSQILTEKASERLLAIARGDADALSENGATSSAETTADVASAKNPSTEAEISSSVVAEPAVIEGSATVVDSTTDDSANKDA